MRAASRICFVAGELLGAHKNGGIGTATTHLALFLARAGHRVTVLYTGAPWIDHADPWIRRCEAEGIALVHLDARHGEIYPVWLRETCVIFDYLRGSEQDVVLFQDWEGPAFASVVAKRAGLAFAGTTLALVAHGPTAWLLDANRTLARDQRTLAHLHMERVAFEGADAVLCPSRHMLGWLRDSGQPLPADVEALPLYLWSDGDGPPSKSRGQTLERVDRVAFFGRLEVRKGVDLFVEAILSDALAGRDFDVVFVGKPASHSPEAIRNAVALRRPSLLPRLSFEPDLDTDAAQSFLIDGRCLAVIPSLIDNAPCVISECLRRGIPFLSTLTGGIPELVAPDDVGRVLVEPHPSALAARLASILGRSFAPARPAHAERETGARWLDWFAALGKAPFQPAAPAPRERPPPRSADRVAVVVTHHERPALVQQTLESLADQTRTGFEVVLVDDGSRSAAAAAGLERMERRAWPFALRVLRQPNRYLGAARNAGVRAADAARIVFMDDDNLAFPNLVETLDDVMSCTRADIVTCQMSIFRDALGEPDMAEVSTAERWGFPGGSLELGLSLNCFGDATGIYRRDVFDRVGFFHEWHGVGYEDWHLHARAAMAGLLLISLPESLYWYRRVPTGMLMSTNGYKNNRIIWHAYAQALPPGLRRLVDLSVRNDLIDGTGGFRP